MSRYGMKAPASGSTSGALALKMLQQVRDPAIPYITKVSYVLKENLGALFQGTVPKNADRFEINFQMGEGTSDDVAFHFNPRIGYQTVLNSFRNGNWENEESAPGKPFTEGTSFQILVAFKSDGYEVYVNKASYCTFKHRMPLEKVSAVSIRGDVTIDLFAVVENLKGLIRKV